MRHLKLGEEAGIRANERFPAMSAIKAALSVNLLNRDRLKPGTLATTVTLTKANQVTGSGRLKRAKPGGVYKVSELLRLMLIDSDNHHLDEALANEQKLFQALVMHEEAKERMRAVQDRFDAGETLRAVYGEPRD